MSNTQYPDNTVLSSDALSIAGIGGVLQPLTLGMLGQQQSSTSNLVRLGWPSEGAPFQQRTEDVCYLLCTEFDADDYDQIRDRVMVPTPGDTEGLTVTEQDAYTRVWRIHWIFYGPNSWDNARMLRSSLYQDYFCQQLAGKGLFPVSAYPRPVRVPENRNGQWIERVDFECQMYEFVQESIAVQTVESVEVVGNIPTGQVFDTTVEGG